MQFVVPQFIDVESKIIGPVTPRQFIILVFFAVLIGLCYKLADFVLFLIEAAVLGLLGIAFAFVKINEQPLYYFLLNILQIFKKPTLRIWQREIGQEVEKVIEEKTKKEAESIIVPRRQALSSSKLSQIALMVDTGGKYEDLSEEIKELDI